MSFPAVISLRQSTLVATLFQLLHNNVHHAILFVEQQVANMLISRPPSDHKILDMDTLQRLVEDRDSEIGQ